jgi:hypothetical protein
MNTFSNLPTPLKGGIAAGGGGLIVAGVLIGTGQWLFFCVLLFFVVIGLAGYFGWRGFKRKQQASRMTTDMQQHATASPRAVSDAAALARLDGMRQKFEKGIREYRSRGKDLYSLPWYTFVGVPGSGKTEAIRHSNVGFPPGMQDEFQGVGGTINMDWWFTNHAVILDTAGKMIFEDVRPGEQSEWKEFLTLLKKNRPNCPINGLFLAIPSDSLISDSADAISQKAGRIAQQLDVIQRILDVRFPVYVIVTKCDKINGFREFFDDLTDPQLQHQMMGWSNPDPLDTAFRPELVDQHLDKVVSRLRRRRMGVLRDPAPQSDSPSARRADEVDALFALPQSLALLAPRLRRYLETIFVAGEWSAKPLFLRGIYFTSSMREGAALDEELAKAIGVAPEELGDEKMWERERAYFLRDLFLDKVFRERGLVTRATNTSRMLRSRQLAMYGAGSLALALIVFLAWFSLSDLEKSVGKTSQKWTAVSKSDDWHRTHVWKQAIVPLEGDDYLDQIRTHVRFGKELPIGDFHDQLRREAIAPQRRGLLSFVFPGVYSDFRSESRKAQRIVFENGVVYPLLDATRQKIKRGITNSPALDRLPGALSALLEFEAAALVAGKGGEPAPLSPAEADRFLAALTRFVAASDVSVPPKLASIMADTYSDTDAGKGWPSPWLGTLTPATKTLSQHFVIDSALKQLKDYSVNSVEMRKQAWAQARTLSQELSSFEQLEKRLFEPAATASAQNLTQTIAALRRHATNIDSQVKAAVASGLFQSGLSLSNAYRQFEYAISTNATIGANAVRQANARASARAKTDFFRQVDAALDDVITAVNAKIIQIQQGENIDTLARLDQLYLRDESYARRWVNYFAVYEACLDNPFKPEELLGGSAEPLHQRLTNFNRGKFAEYQGPLAKEFQKTMESAWELAYTVQRQRFRHDYLAAATNRIRPYIRFPLCRDLTSQPLDTKSVGDAFLQFAKFSKEMAGAEPLKHKVFTENQDWTGFASRVSKYHSLATALLRENLKPWTCEITLAPYNNDSDPGKWRDTYGGISIGDTVPKLTRTGQPQPLGEFTIDQALTFTLHNDPNDPAKGKMNGPALTTWAVIQLLLDDRNKAVRNDDGSWSVALPLRIGAGDAGTIALKIQFTKEAKLPETKDWGGPL